VRKGCSDIFQVGVVVEDPAVHVDGVDEGRRENHSTFMWGWVVLASLKRSMRAVTASWEEPMTPMVIWGSSLGRFDARNDGLKATSRSILWYLKSSRKIEKAEGEEPVKRIKQRDWTSLPRRRKKV
jgi:hypothetical protein